MFKKIKTQKLMNALYLLFIFVRHDPEHRIHKDLIQAFRNHFRNEKKFTNIRALIRDLEHVEKNYYRDSILRELKQAQLTIYKFELKQVRNKLPVFQEILDQLQVKSSLQEFEKLKVMASSVHNYPHYVINKFKSTNMWEEQISYYYKRFNEDFLNMWKNQL